MSLRKIIISMFAAWSLLACGGDNDSIGGRNTITCTATAPENGSIDAADVAEDATADYSCNEGYALSGDAPSCTSAGTFDGNEPTCEIVICTATAPNHGSVAAVDVAVDATADYSCGEGYTLSGAAPSCTSAGTFDGNEPTCEIFTCEVTAPAGGSIQGGVSAIDYNTTATYVCSDNRGLIGTPPTCLNEDFDDSKMHCVDYLKAYYNSQSDAAAGNNFGNAIALSGDGNTLAIGAPYRTNDLHTNSGAVYVFVRDSQEGTWSFQKRLTSYTIADDDYFGASVSLSYDGNRLAIGANGEDSTATGVNSDTSRDGDASGTNNVGAVYLFERDNGNQWLGKSYIKRTTAANYGQFGFAISLSADGNTLAVGAYSQLVDVSIYRRNIDNGAWSKEGDLLKGENTTGTSKFGYAVGLSADGNALVVGDYTDVSNLGGAYVFKRVDGAWSRDAHLTASNAESNDSFGYAVAISGDGKTIAVGAKNEDSNGTGIDGMENNNDADGSGAVYVFSYADSTWSQNAYMKANTSDSGDNLGYAVVLSTDGNTLVAGAIYKDGKGAAYVYSRSEGTWAKSDKIVAPNASDNDRFGSAVSLSSSDGTLAVGAPSEEDSEGAAYVLHL